jgi:flagellar biosynthesis protein FlhA
LRAKASTDPESLIEAARLALGPALVARFADGGRLSVITVEPALEQTLVQDLRPGDGGTQLVMDAAKLDGILGSLSSAVAAAESAGKSAVLVCAPILRPAIRRLVPHPPGGVPVLSYAEVTSASVSIETIGVVRVGSTVPA